MTLSAHDTIAAIATAPGKGGVGVVRLSGAKALNIAEQLINKKLPERQAVYSHFRDSQGQIIDSGIVIYFAGPRSFTGEDVVEFQGHGGPVILDLLMTELIHQGARQARAGEFSERAFLNDKLDLAQAEAIADLIDSTTATAAQAAMRSLQGEFSKHINALTQELIELRVFVEAAIDFPEEEIDFLADEGIRTRLSELQKRLRDTLAQAQQGVILTSGLTVVLAGKPNAGKSSLLNALAGDEAAIVTDIPGTTRDVIRQTINLDGLPIHLVDTAGLRDTEDQVEKIGVQRAQAEIEKSDHILHLIDANEVLHNGFSAPELAAPEKTTFVVNKIDLVNDAQLTAPLPNSKQISVQRGDGLTELVTHLKQVAGFQGESETTFTARRRHITALSHADQAVNLGIQQLEQTQAGELLADELRQAQHYLSEITGEFSADDLLGEIFSGFCIGK